MTKESFKRHVLLAILTSATVTFLIFPSIQIGLRNCFESNIWVLRSLAVVADTEFALASHLRIVTCQVSEPQPVILINSIAALEAVLLIPIVLFMMPLLAKARRAISGLSETARKILAMLLVLCGLFLANWVCYYVIIAYTCEKIGMPLVRIFMWAAVSANVATPNQAASYDMITLSLTCPLLNTFLIAFLIGVVGYLRTLQQRLTRR